MPFIKACTYSHCFLRSRCNPWAI